jgi:Na+-translocating ferredoxin:NAD+ oxidoreductase RnfG subunit
MKKPLLVLCCVIGTSAQAAELLSLKDFLKQELSDFPKLTKESFNVSDADKAELLKVAPDATDTIFNFYFGRTADGKLGRSCTVVPQNGKEGPLSVGVCYSTDHKVTGVRILAHQEERGKKIEEESFLKQFTGKKASDAYILGQDVDGITGATWSSKAMAEALRKASYAYKKFVQSKESK